MILKTDFTLLKSPVQYVNFPDSAVPASTVLEKAFFPNYNDIIDLSYLKIKDRVLVIAIKNQDSFEKQVICNSYTRVA